MFIFITQLAMLFFTSLLNYTRAADVSLEASFGESLWREFVSIKRLQIQITSMIFYCKKWWYLCTNVKKKFPKNEWYLKIFLEDSGRRRRSRRLHQTQLHLNVKSVQSGFPSRCRRKVVSVLFQRSKVKTTEPHRTQHLKSEPLRSEMEP